MFSLLCFRFQTDRPTMVVSEYRSIYFVGFNLYSSITNFPAVLCFYFLCFDTVGWVTGMAYRLVENANVRIAGVDDLIGAKCK